MVSNIWVQVKLKFERSVSAVRVWFSSMTIGIELVNIQENCGAVSGLMARVRCAWSMGLGIEQGIRELNKIGK